MAQRSSTVSADQIWNDLAAGNRRFVVGKTAPKDFLAQRNALTKTQHPRVAVLSCSDSRVAPELVFDTGLGDLFVVRSAGEDDDPLSIGSLEYAVEHLGSSMIVVMGHQSCGAVTAACSGGKSESANLDAVLTPIAPSCAKMDPKRTESLDLAVRDHVRRVAQDGNSGVMMIDTQIATLKGMIAQAMKPHQEAVMRLAEVPSLGVDSAQQIIAEVGVQASTFPSRRRS